MCGVRMETQDVVFTATSPDTLSAIVQIDVRSEDASHVEQTRPPCKGFLAGKRQRGICKGQQASPIPVSPKRTIIVATIKTQAANIIGKVGNVQIEMLMDSGSSISLITGYSKKIERVHSKTLTSNYTENSIRRDSATAQSHQYPSVYPEYGCPSGP